MNTSEQTDYGIATPDPPLGTTGLGLGTTGSGVASLDSPLIQQTKAEIRTLAADIAGLAHSSISPDDFFEGFLPRLCVAMGASAAAVWDLQSAEEPRLTANHGLPPVLLTEDAPSEAHARILACAIAEGRPILVPPGTVTVDAERPKNPLNEALIIVPVRIQENVDYAVEVVQRPSGGPAAQRGYLRFVTQMADLLADYLRRQALRKLDTHHDRLERLEHWLLQLASQATAAQRATVTAEALADMLDADQVLLFERPGRINVLAISGVPSIDPRSEVVLAAKALLTVAAKSNASECNPCLSWYTATDRRQATQLPSVQQEPDDPPNCQDKVDNLCELLRCRRLLYLRLSDHPEQHALLAYVSTAPACDDGQVAWERDAQQLAQSLGKLATRQGSNSGWRSWLLMFHRQPQRSRTVYEAVRTWVARLAVCGLVLALAAFPVPQQFTATAILQPTGKTIYFAPVNAVVSQVLVEEGQTVAKDTPLLQLKSRELQNEIDQLEGELQLNQDRLDELAGLRNRGADLTSRETDRLEGEIKLLEVSQKTAASRLRILLEMEADLRVVASEAGTVTSWNVANQLNNKPVQAGEVLLTTYEPEGRWNLELAFPDYRVGEVAEAIEAAQKKDPKSGALVHFSLSSHPDQLFQARLVKLASHAIARDPNDLQADSRVVLGLAELDATRLPLRKDGAIARATIDCGQVAAIWLVFRDAYRAVSSRIQMLW